MGRSSNLYEILRQATKASPQTPKAGAAPALDESPRRNEPATATITPPPSVAVPSPEKVETEPVVVEKPRLKVEPARVHVPVAPPAPNPVPPSGASAAPGNPGSRILELTYNAGAFALLAVLGLLFVVYSIGVRVGRNSGPAAAASPSPETAPAPTIVPPLFSIQLMEWPVKTAEAGTKAQFAAGEMKNQLEKLGYREARIVTIGRDADTRVMLLYGYFDNRSSDPARNASSQLKSVKLGKDREATFGKTAKFVEIKR